jgi:hypothetical protein
MILPPLFTSTIAARRASCGNCLQREGDLVRRHAPSEHLTGSARDVEALSVTGPRRIEIHAWDLR